VSVRWTASETDTLCDAIAEGRTFAVAAARAGKSRSATISRWLKIVH